MTAGRDRRKLAAFAMSPKSHICRWLHEEIVPRAGSWLASSKAGGDQNGLHLGSVTGSSDAENRLGAEPAPGASPMERREHCQG